MSQTLVIMALYQHYLVPLVTDLNCSSLALKQHKRGERWLVCHSWAWVDRRGIKSTFLCSVLCRRDAHISYNIQLPQTNNGGVLYLGGGRLWAQGEGYLYVNTDIGSVTYRNCDFNALVKLVHNNPWTWLLGKIVLFAKFWGIPTHIPNNQMQIMFQWKRLKKWKSLKSGRREIQFQQGNIIAKIFPICVLDRGHPGLSHFAFDCLICV